MLPAAIDTDLSPRELSFTGAMQAMAAGWTVNPILNSSTIVLMVSAQIESLTSQVVGQRPNRIEPRAIKRRPKPHRLLNMTRQAAREKLLQGTDPYKQKQK